MNYSTQSPPMTLDAQALRLPLKTTVRHASASRKNGESLWVRATRNGKSGFGEGCPRHYVTGERLNKSLAWLQEKLSFFEAHCATLEDVEAMAFSDEVAHHPSAWCAVETALLDLLARESGTSVEELLGLATPCRKYEYTAVLGDDAEWKLKILIDMYLVCGFTDFKIKLNGDLESDTRKLHLVEQLAAEHEVGPMAIRLDANNLWTGDVDAAINHLSQLSGRFVAIEEPVAPRQAEELSRISRELQVAIILDESLARVEDVHRFDELPGEFIGNIKVSKAGGVLNSLRIAAAMRERGWAIIVGAHVGETSVMTRAAMCVAQAAGDSLIAQEGAFGTKLAEYETASPSLMYHHLGVVDLRLPFAEKTAHGLRLTQPENWKQGWGLECRWPERPVEEMAGAVSTLEMSDDYQVHYRQWGDDTAEDVVIILHGGMSHSEWQTPLANALCERSDVTVVAPDRRGCGLNAGKGDLGSVHRSIQDVVEQLIDLKRRFKRVHLAAWCQGAQFASLAAAQLVDTDIVSSLTFITPGLFWNERFRSVIDAAEMVVDKLVDDFDLQPDRELAFVPVPLTVDDFTDNPRWIDYVEQDPLKTERITMKSACIMDEIQEMSWMAVHKLRLPMLTVYASRDRIVDNRKAKEFLGELVERNAFSCVRELDASHAVQFEQPEALADMMTAFLMTERSSPHTREQTTALLSAP